MEPGVAAVMRAMTYSKYGSPDVLELTDQPVPKVPPASALIRVRAAAVNPVDWKIMAGYLDPMMNVVFPVIPGWDVAGVVEKVGLDTPEFAPGDEVIAYARQDYVQGGTLAEYVTAPVRTMAAKPSGVSWEQAAGLPLAGLTAYQLLTRLHVTDSDTVLIHAASGGVGSLATQIAVSLGARVIGTASPENHDFLRQLGADPVQYGDGLAERVRDKAPDGVSVVLDFVGGVLEVTRAVLSDGGRHASIADHAVSQAGGLYLWTRPDADDLAALVGLVDAGRLNVEIAQTFPLEQAAEAMRLSQTGRTRGKIAISVG